MPLTPEEVRARRFRVGLLGYRRREVVSFLRAVAWDYKTTLEEAMTRDPAPAEAREVERLLQCVHESIEVLRLLAELEMRREHAGAALVGGASVEFRLSGAARVLLAAAEALERAMRVVLRRIEVGDAHPPQPTDPVEPQESCRVRVESARATRTVLSQPPPPPGVSTSVHAPG
jgi:DivIVA domain-containing protein